MYEVVAEGTKFYYIEGTEPPERIEARFSVGMPSQSILKLALETESVRLVVFESLLRSGIGNLYFGYWVGDEDLDKLDLHVAKGSYSDEDFSTFVKTTYQETICTNCGNVWQTLVIPPGDPYPGAPGLLQKKISLSKIEVCPSCKARLDN